MLIINNMQIDKNKKVQNSYQQEQEQIWIIESQSSNLQQFIKQNESNKSLYLQNHNQLFSLGQIKNMSDQIKKQKKVQKPNDQSRIQQSDDIEFELMQPRRQKYKRFVQQNSIDQKDVKEIIIIVLLVLIFGISLFRVILEVQVQYKNEQSMRQFRENRLNDEGLALNHGPEWQEIQKYYAQNAPLTSPIKITLTKECEQQIQSIALHLGSLYELKYPMNQFSIMSRVSSYNGYANTGISKEKYEQSVALLYLNHKINEQGIIEVEQSQCQNRSAKIERLKQLINKQHSRWDKEYQIDSYKNKQLRFCIVTNSYNNGKNGLYYRNLDSIRQQNYRNYHVVYTDDYSVDRTGALVKEYLIKHKLQSKFKLILNQKKVGMMENIYNAITYHCQQGQIAIMLDGDDSFIGTNVLSLVNAIYQKQKLALMWSNFLCIFNNGHASIGFSRDYAQKQKDDNSFRRLKGFISSHLKTFFVDLFRKIKVQDLQHNNGKFYGGASDTVMMIPMLEMANPRIKYLTEILYEYRYDTEQVGNNVNKVAQKQALKKLYQTKPYEKLEDFSFVENALMKLQQSNSQQLQKDEQQIGTSEQSIKNPQKQQDLQNLNTTKPT